MKHLIICCDGTWQTLHQGEPTNVARLAAGFAGRDAGGAVQLVYYDRGVGAAFQSGAGPLRISSWFERLAGGAFGAGLEAKIFAAYRFLALNHAPGDRISMFGFSRGAYLVRSLCGLIHASGLVRRDALDRLDDAWALYRDSSVKPGDAAARDFRKRHARKVHVTLLGCFDTVAARGAPDLIPASPLDRWLNRAHRFHDHRVNTAVRRARHACAVDEDRPLFALTPMAADEEADDGQVCEVWFPGFHGGVGGGDAATRGLADLALSWMAGEARSAGLGLDQRLERRLRPDPLAELNPPSSLTRLIRRARSIDAGARLHPGVGRRWREAPQWRPAALSRLAPQLDAATERKSRMLDEEEQHRQDDGRVDRPAGDRAIARHARFSSRGPAAAGAMAVS